MLLLAVVFAGKLLVDADYWGTSFLAVLSEASFFAAAALHKVSLAAAFLHKASFFCSRYF